MYIFSVHFVQRVYQIIRVMILLRNKEKNGENRDIHEALGINQGLVHYENTPMQYTAIVHSCKNDSFRLNIFDYFHIFAQNIDCGYALEPPH